METEGVSGDFTACDTGVLNRFFRWYYLVLRGAQPGRDEYEATEPAALVLVAGYRVRAPAPVYGRSCAVCTETVDVSSAYAFEVNGPCTWVKVG